MFEIIEERKKWMIINKPSGISVHNEEGSVIDFFKKNGHNYSPAHRIDKETSGLLLLSKDNSFTESLQSALQSAEKYYVAVCRGSIKEKAGVWSNPLSEKAEGRKNPSGKKASQKKALSHWTCQKSNKYLSLLEVKILTGRTHQIRRHAVLNKHAILGDSRYGEKKYNELILKNYEFKRMALHARRLKIEIDNEKFDFICETPTTFHDLLTI